MPSSDKPTRKLAAIVFTDIAGYTEQMSKNQDVAFTLLEEKQNIFRPLVKEHNGTLIKEMGDGTLSHYPTAVDASTCSVNLQQRIKDNDKLNVRIGIHLGDTMFKDNDVFGDGVNIASRLESMSPAGGILVSKNVYDELLSRKGFEGVSLGLQSLKGVGRLVEVYALKDTHLTVPSPDDYLENKIDVHSDNEVPSIAIIPFENKGKEEDVFYAYGISVDLISDVTSAGLIRVASKKQIDAAGDLPQDELAKKLDVRYMANGELWRMGDMFQLFVELYDTKDKKVIWSDRWQENWDNLSTIKMNLSDGLLKALDTTSKVEKKVETTDTEAYEFYLKAKNKYDKRETMQDTKIARELLRKAIELDDNLIKAKANLGWTYSDIGEYDKAMEIYTPMLKQTEEVGDKDGMAMSLMNIGNVYYNKDDYIKALNYFEWSHKISEKLGNKKRVGNIINNIGLVYYNKGNYVKALDYYERSLVIDEELGDKRGMGSTFGNIGLVCANKGDYDKALDYHTRSLEISEKLGDKSGMEKSLGNIGNIYSYKGDYDKGLDYYIRTFDISEELGDKVGVGRSLCNIGLVYANKGDYIKALDYQTRSLAIDEEVGSKRGMKKSLGNIGDIYSYKGDHDIALNYQTRSLDISEELGDKRGMGISLMSIGIVYANKGDYVKALDYFERSLVIAEELGYKYGIGILLSNISNIYGDKGFFDKAIDYSTRSLRIQEELIDKHGMGISIGNIGSLWASKDNNEKALDYQTRSLDIREKLGDKDGVGHSLSAIGTVYYSNGDYEKAIEYLEKSLAIKKEIGLGTGYLLESTTHLYLSYKNLDKIYDINEIHTLIKEAENIEFELNLRLYQLLEDKGYLETAYNQVQDKASEMDEDLAKKFHNYSIPKAIVEEWEKVK